MKPDDIDTIYPRTGNPYYIVAAPYTRTSAGVRALYMLCHSLNRRGYQAYVLVASPWPFHKKCDTGNLLTPYVTPRLVRKHFNEGLAPIVVYPEIIAGNPYNGPAVVRYVLNFPGLLAGDKQYAPEELCFSYSKTLAAATRSPDNVLFVPTMDTGVFHPASEGQKRQGSCFYASKYQIVHKGTLFDVTKNSVEITRDLPNSQTPDQIAELFRRSEIFYTYENTALATEAVVCGCPAVFLPNPYLTEIIAAAELGPEGYAWGTDAAEVARAKATVMQGADNYYRTYATFWQELDHFIAQTQKHASGKIYRTPVVLPKYCESLSCKMRQHGPFGFLCAIGRKLREVVVDRA